MAEEFAIQEYRFKVKGTPYVLQEATEGAVLDYRGAMIKATRNPDGSERKDRDFDGLNQLERLLVSLCVYRLKDDKDEAEPLPKPVGTETVSTFPTRLVKKLYKMAEQFSELGDYSPEAIERAAKEKGKEAADSAPKSEPTS